MGKEVNVRRTLEGSIFSLLVRTGQRQAGGINSWPHRARVNEPRKKREGLAMKGKGEAFPFIPSHSRVRLVSVNFRQFSLFFAAATCLREITRCKLEAREMVAQAFSSPTALLAVNTEVSKMLLKRHDHATYWLFARNIRTAFETNIVHT